MEKRLSGGYVQLWEAMNKDEIWEVVIPEMKSLGMDTIIIQYMSSFLEFDKSMPIAAMILKYAKQNNMKVFLGLQQGNTGHSSSVQPDKLNISKDACKNIAKDLKVAFENYEDTFYGWHIPLESWTGNYNDETINHLQWYYKTLTEELKNVLPKKVLISPFINGPRTTPEHTRTIYTKILKDTEIDFLALQDGVGAEHISVSNPDLPEYFAAMCDACKANNIELWANIESFTKGTATDIDRFTQQLDVAQGASRIVTFDYFHYMNSDPLWGTDRPDGYTEAVKLLHQRYRAWREGRQTLIETEAC
jgi:hypothetical protein